MGKTDMGLLGLSEKPEEKTILRPTQITINLPEPGSKNKIIEIKTGCTHSMAIT